MSTQKLIFHVEARRRDAYASLVRCKDAEITLDTDRAGNPDDVFFQEATQGLHDRFEIEYVTLQVVCTPFSQPCERAATITTSGRNRTL